MTAYSTKNRIRGQIAPGDARIVWELPLEGSALELLNDAEGETGKVSKLDEAKRFLRAALSKRERPQDEVKTEAAAQNISWGTLNARPKAARSSSAKTASAPERARFGGYHDHGSANSTL